MQMQARITRLLRVETKSNMRKSEKSSPRRFGPDTIKQRFRDQSVQRAESRRRGDHHPKTAVVVPAVREVPVAGGAARAVPIVVPGAAAQHQKLIIFGVQNFAAIMGIIRVILVKAAGPFPDVAA